MVRYIRNDELYHEGVKGMRWYHRRYQYEDGRYTPLGRIHYGIGEYKDKTVGEKLLDTPRAIKNTYATYGYGKYRAKVKTNPSETDKAFMKRADEAREKRLKEKQEKKANAEAAAQKRLEETRARAEEKNREAAEARKKIEEKEAENRKKYKEEADKKADERIEELKKSVKELGEDIDKRLRGEIDEEANGKEEAKSGKFEKFSNEELRKFTERTRLETEANRAMVEARMLKMDVPRQLIDTLVNYGNAGLTAFNVFRSFKGSYDAYKNNLVQTPVQIAAQDLLSTFGQVYATGALKDPDTAIKFKEEMFKEQQMLDAMSKIFEYTKSHSNNDTQNDNNKGGKGGKKKGNGN